MINLLPKTKIAELKKEREVLIIFNLGIMFFLFLVFLALILFLLKIYFEGLLIAEKIIFETEQARLNLSLEKEIEKYNSLLSKISFFQKEKVNFLPIFEEILNIIPEKVNLQSFNFELKQKNEIFISLSGTAEDRETLLGLVKELKERYSDVSFSPQILVKPTNIEFSFGFKIIKNER